MAKKEQGIPLEKAKQFMPEVVYEELRKQGITQLRPSQEKAIRAGLFERKNELICTPTASGKTLVAELVFINELLEMNSEGEIRVKPQRGIAVYVVPLRALASEKYRSFSKKYPQLKVTLTSGDMDSDDKYLADYDLIITTSEKLDSLIRHSAPWIQNIRVLIVDEIHLLNDAGRGPTLEILLTILRQQNPKLQLIGLSATIGNPKQLADWLEAELVEDSWRPVELRKGILLDGELEFD